MKLGGMILSGGKSSRMGEDKSLKKIDNKTLIDLVLQKSIKQVDYIFINSNSIREHRFENSKIDIVKDCLKGSLGPLAGVLTGIKHLKKKNDDYRYLMNFPVDSPFFPDDIVKKFLPYAKKYEIIFANHNQRNHPTFSMWDLNLEKDIENYLKKGSRKIEDFTIKKKTKVVKFENFGYDPFFNINTKADLDLARKKDW